ncbi:MAG: CapA family protein [Dehalococcoidia bacterium]
MRCIPGPRLSLLVVLAFIGCACTANNGAQVRIESLGTGGTAVRVAVPDGLRDRFERIAAIVAPSGQSGQSIQILQNDAAADLRVIVNPPGLPGAVVRRWAIVAAAARIDLDDLPLKTVMDAAGTGSLYVPQDSLGLVEQLFLQRAGLRPLSAEEIPKRLAAEPAAFAIVPADTVGTRVHALSIDGVDPVRGSEDLGSYPLVTRVTFEVLRHTQSVEALAARLPQAMERVDPQPLRLDFTGDLIPSRCVYDQMRRSGDWAAPFRQVAGRLRSADLTAGSLDASISVRGAPIGCRETFNLLTVPEVIQGFSLAGLDVITVAANHAKDCGGAGSCGDAAFLETLSRLRAAGIQPTGGGATLAEARRPAVLRAGGIRFAFLGYDDVAPYYHATEHGAGTAGLDPATLADDIRSAHQVADVVIVMPHWGVEYTADPTARQREAAKIAIDAGATLVVGNHPHVVQAAAPVGDGYVAWALGNFVFDQDWSQETTEGVVLEATFAGPHLAAVRFLPIRIQNQIQPVFLGSEAGKPILQRMIAAAAHLDKNP